MTIVFNDTFTGTGQLASHTSDTLDTWSMRFGDPASSQIVDTDALITPLTTSGGQSETTGTFPTGTDLDITVKLVRPIATTADFANVDLEDSGSNFNALIMTVQSNATTWGWDVWGESFNTTNTPGTTVTLRIEIRGAAVTIFVDDVEEATALTSAKPGVDGTIALILFDRSWAQGSPAPTVRLEQLLFETLDPPVWQDHIGTKEV